MAKVIITIELEDFKNEDGDCCFKQSFFSRREGKPLEGSPQPVILNAYAAFYQELGKKLAKGCQKVPNKNLKVH